MLRYLFLSILTILSVGNSHLVCVAGVESGDEAYAVYSALLNEKYVEQRTPFLIVMTRRCQSLS